MWKCGLTTLHIFQNHGHYGTSMSARVSTNNRKETNSPHIMTSSHLHDILCPDVGGRDSLQSKMTLPKGPAQKGRMSSSALWKPDTTSSWWQMLLEAKSAKPMEVGKPSQVSEPKEAGWLTTMWNLEWDSITTTKKKTCQAKHKKIWMKYQF